MSLAKKSIGRKSSSSHARKAKSNCARSTKSKLLHEYVGESQRDAQRKREDQAKAAERFADWFFIDLGIRG